LGVAFDVVAPADIVSNRSGTEKSVAGAVTVATRGLSLALRSSRHERTDSAVAVVMPTTVRSRTTAVVKSRLRAGVRSRLTCRA